MISGIYTITAPSGSFYVGSAADMDRRWAKHVRDLQRGVHGNCNLQRAAAKYGIDALVFCVLLICDRSSLLLFEQRAIDALFPPYNIARVAGSGLGIKRSDEFKAKVSAGLRGRPVSPETREKIAAKNRLRKMSPEQVRIWHAGLKPVPLEEKRRRAAAMHMPEARRKKAQAMVGHSTSEATRAKISAALKGRPHSPARIAAITAGKIAARSVVVTLQNGS